MYSQYFIFKILRKNWKYFSDANLFYAAVKILFTECNCIFFIVSLFMDAHLYIILLTTFISFTTIFFIKLKQIDSLLQYRTGKRINIIRIKRFLYHHSNVVVDILGMNTFFSRVLFAYIISIMPMNIFLVTSSQYTNMGRGNKLLVPFCAIIVSQQMIGLLLLHFTCAFYTKKIHQHSKRLIQMNIRIRHQSLQTKVKISFFIEKFHTVKCYGITYGNFALITMLTFIKVEFFKKK